MAHYNLDEDATIMSIGREAVAEGTPLHTAFIKIADDLGRPVSSIHGRYKRLLSLHKKENTSLSEGEMLILKLKSFHREKNRNAEKVDIYKDKFHALQKEHEKIKREFSDLKQDYQTLIDTVKMAIGEDKE